MLDSDDSDDLFLISLFTDGPWGIIIFIIAVIVWFVVQSNEEECEAMTCKTGEPVLIQGECRCLEKAK